MTTTEAPLRPGPAPTPPPQAHPFSETTAETLRLAVAPSTGRFRGSDAGPGTRVRAGDLLGYVTGGRGRADEVRSPVAGVVRGLLVHPGRLVSQGQHLVWLETA